MPSSLVAGDVVMVWLWARISTWYSIHSQCWWDGGWNESVRLSLCGIVWISRRNHVNLLILFLHLFTLMRSREMAMFSPTTLIHDRWVYRWMTLLSVALYFAGQCKHYTKRPRFIVLTRMRSQFSSMQASQSHTLITLSLKYSELNWFNAVSSQLTQPKLRSQDLLYKL